MELLWLLKNGKVFYDFQLEQKTIQVLAGFEAQKSATGIERSGYFISALK
jgi:hypothetical protein